MGGFPDCACVKGPKARRTALPSVGAISSRRRYAQRTGPVRRGRRAHARANRRAAPRGPHRASHVRPAREPLAGPTLGPRVARRCRPRRRSPAQPVPGPLAQRRRPGGFRRRAGARRAAARADRGGRDDRGGARRPLPADRRPQGARRLRVPRAPPRERRVRPDPSPSGVALDGQLLPRRRRDLDAARLPWRRGASRGDEPRALRLARALGGGARRHRADARHREQRQGDLRPLQGARNRPGERDPQPVLRVRELPRPLPRDRCGAGAGVRVPARAGRRAPAPRVRVGDGLGGHDRRRRPPEGALRVAGRRMRGARVPDAPLQRLRRAQHPGDRGQAHPADPQRPQHGRRPRGLRPGDRPPRRPLWHRGRPAPPRRGAAFRRR